MHYTRHAGEHPQHVHDLPARLRPALRRRRRHCRAHRRCII